MAVTENADGRVSSRGHIDPDSHVQSAIISFLDIIAYKRTVCDRLEGVEIAAAMSGIDPDNSVHLFRSLPDVEGI